MNCSVLVNRWQLSKSLISLSASRSWFICSKVFVFGIAAFLRWYTDAVDTSVCLRDTLLTSFTACTGRVEPLKFLITPSLNLLLLLSPRGVPGSAGINNWSQNFLLRWHVAHRAIFANHVSGASSQHLLAVVHQEVRVLRIDAVCVLKCHIKALGDDLILFSIKFKLGYCHTFSVVVFAACLVGCLLDVL